MTFQVSASPPLERFASWIVELGTYPGPLRVLPQMAHAGHSLKALRGVLRGNAAHISTAPKVAALPAELVAKQNGPWGLLSNEEKKQRKKQHSSQK